MNTNVPLATKVRLLVLALVAVTALTLIPAPVYAAGPVVNPDGSSSPAQKYSLTGCASNIPANDCNIITKYLNPFIKILSVMVGIAVVIGIIIGGIQYAASAGDPQKAAGAKLRIRNAVIALLAYFFLYAFLKFLIPGGSAITG